MAFGDQWKSRNASCLIFSTLVFFPMAKTPKKELATTFCQNRTCPKLAFN